VEGEAGAQRRLLEIHLGAEQEKRGLRRDIDMGAVALDMVILGVGLGHQVDRVFHAGATALLDAEADAVRVVAGGNDLAHPVGGLFGHRDDGEASHSFSFSIPCRFKACRMIPHLKW